MAFSTLIHQSHQRNLGLPSYEADSTLAPEGSSSGLARARSGENLPGLLQSRDTHGDSPMARRDMTDGSTFVAHSSLDIVLASSSIILRGAGGDYEPSLLTGEVVLTLSEATNIREITASLVGKCKINYTDTHGGSSKHYTDSITIMEHDWSFLQGERKHMHTLKAGRHAFPFQMQLDGHLPASIRTMGGYATITYKLRANAIRSAFATNFSDTKIVTLVRTFSPDALEYTQTLELENTWPGKIMYSIMIPHRAHAAGSQIPVSVKFSPLTKGVKVANITSEVKEYTTLHSKFGVFSMTRTAATAKHTFENGRAVACSPGGLRTPIAIGGALPRSALSTASLTGLAAQSSRESSDAGLAEPHHHAFSSGTPSHSSSAHNSEPGTPARQTSMEMTEEAERDLMHGEGDTEATFKVSLPLWVTPSHAIKPVVVSHKIKWVCMLTNLDGHTSELRCALPVHILASSVADEARTATSTAYSILFGASEAAQEPVVELPSYPEHVRDRVANAALDPSAPVVSASSYTTPGTSPRAGLEALTTPPELAMQDPMLAASLSRTSSRQDLGQADVTTPLAVPSSFYDSELISSIGHAFASNGVGSAGSSSYASTPSSSRPGSRPASPEPSDSVLSLASEATTRPSAGLFHLTGLKPLTTFKGKGKAPSPPEGTPTSATPTYGGTRWRGHSSSRPSSRPASPPPLPPPAQPPNPLTQVPHYEIASRGFLGGGVVPLTASHGLPSYDEVERIERSRSETSLVDLRRRVEEASLAEHQPAPSHPHHLHPHPPRGLTMTSIERTSS